MTTEADCIFCKIVAGDIPCHKLYETDEVLAFLDVMPLSNGHCLVIPKAHYETLDQMPEELAGSCGRVLPRLSRALQATTEAEGWNVLQNNGGVAGQVVPHVHFHIIPRASGDGLGFRWPAGKLEGDAAKELSAQIAALMDT